MDKSGRRHSNIQWFAALFGLMLLLGIGQPVLAMPSIPWIKSADSKSAFDSGTTLPTQNPSGRLREVEPPGGVQQLHEALAKYHPRLSLISPADRSQLKGGPLNLELKIEDWPLANDLELGLGPHVAIQIDDHPPLRISEWEENYLKLQIPALSPGSHRFSAYAAYPWGEAVKTPGASLNWQLDQLRPLAGTQPEPDSPWLAVVSPAELGSETPLLLDWLVWNAPLQNLRAGDARWRLRITINNDSFVVDQQEALWLKGIDKGNDINSVQMELLNGIGESIAPMFNNQLRAIPGGRNPKPIWLQPNLTGTEISRLLGEAQPDEQSATLPNSEPLQPTASTLESFEEFIPEQELTEEERPSDSSSNAGSLTEGLVIGEPVANKAKPNETVDVQQDLDSKSNTASEPTPESNKVAETEPNSTPRAPVITKEPERILPSSTLGGSARDLLNADGTQR